MHIKNDFTQKRWYHDVKIHFRAKELRNSNLTPRVRGAVETKF